MVPVIDMQQITQFLQEETLYDFGQKLLSDLSSFGLVQLVSHGIPIVSCLRPLNSIFPQDCQMATEFLQNSLRIPFGTAVKLFQILLTFLGFV